MISAFQQKETPMVSVLLTRTCVHFFFLFFFTEDTIATRTHVGMSGCTQSLKTTLLDINCTGPSFSEFSVAVKYNKVTSNKV